MSWQDTKERIGAQMVADTKILIVDDDEVVRLGYLRSLAGADWTVESVWDGNAALRKMQEKIFDVVLLDLRTPGMDGMDVLRAIKDKWPDTQVVIITGYPTVETVKEALRLGACDYLAKPVDPDGVINAANEAMAQKRWALRRERTNQTASNEFMH
jgi:two-component system response regulator AtoC